MKSSNYVPLHQYTNQVAVISHTLLHPQNQTEQGSAPTDENALMPAPLTSQVTWMGFRSVLREPRPPAPPPPAWPGRTHYCM